MAVTTIKSKLLNYNGLSDFITDAGKGLNYAMAEPSSIFDTGPHPHAGEEFSLSNTSQLPNVSVAEFLKIAKEHSPLTSKFAKTNDMSKHFDPNSIHVPKYVKTFEFMYSHQHFATLARVEFFSGAVVEAKLPHEGFALFDHLATTHLTSLGFEFIEFATRYGQLLQQPEGPKTIPQVIQDKYGITHHHYSFNSMTGMESPPILLLGGARSGEFVQDSGPYHASLESNDTEIGTNSFTAEMTSTAGVSGMTSMTLEHYSKEKLYMEKHGTTSLAYVYYHPSIPPEARYSMFCSAMEEFPEIRISFPYHLFWNWK